MTGNKMRLSRRKAPRNDRQGLPRVARNDKGRCARNYEWRTVPNLLAYAIALFLLFSFWSISLSQIFLTCALILWIILLVTKKLKFEIPRFFWPLMIYALLSLISSFRSVNAEVSLIDSKDLLLFLVVPITYLGLREEKNLNHANLALMASVWISIFYSLFSYFFAPPQSQRITGFMGHYMTQAGLLLLFISLALGILFFSRRKLRFLWGATLFFATVILILTQTRSAWIGAVVAASVILFLYKPKTLVLIPIIIGLVFLVSPKNVKQRALSIFSLKGYSNVHRIEYVKAGLKIMKNRPFFGTGPDTVDMEFQLDKYGLSEEAKQNVHLHNNIFQIGAERGIPALLAWLAFLILAVIDLFKLIKDKNSSIYPLAAGALAALAGLFVAGFFEYNFGDSEITTLFLYVLTIPFVAAQLSLRGKK